MSNGLYLLVPALIAGSLVPAQSRAQEAPVACPKPGTVVQMVEAGSKQSLTWLGADPSDDAICLVQAADGSVVKRLYARYDLSRAPWVEGYDTARRALAYLFSGEKDRIGFGYAVRSGAGKLIFHATWQMAGREPIVIGGQQIEATKYSMSEFSLLGGYAEKWEFLYDPVSHLFVKGTRTVDSESKGGKENSFVISEISVPH
jgi:hypothetical protein